MGMQAPEEVKELFSEYSDYLSNELLTYLDGQRTYDMYGMMRYFMGFADKDFKPIPAFGGKRFRSSLCLMIADRYGDKDAALCAALSLELFHNFTLIHDDIVDGDELRRGRPTVWKLWGSDHGINTGDAQAMLAYHVLTCGSKENPSRGLPVQEFLTERYLEVIEGQYLDFVLTDLPLGDEQLTEDAYFEMITKKTAVLIGAATKAAGMAVGARDEECDALWQYGLNLGIAYQLCDDAISIWGDPSVTGKIAHGDILAKKKTLPVLYAVSRMNGNDRNAFENMYNDKEPLNDGDAIELIRLLDTTDTHDHVREQINHYKSQSKQALDELSLSDDAKETLIRVNDALLPDSKSL